MSDRPFTDWQQLGLCARIANALVWEQIHTVDQLRELGPHRFLRLSNIGPGSVEEVRRVIGWGHTPEPAPSEPPPPEVGERIATALERIATVLEKAYRASLP
jgi:hypothetical protein